MLIGRLVVPPEPDGARSLKMMANNVQLTKSSMMVAVMHKVPMPPLEDAEIHQNPGQHRVRNCQVHAHEQGEGEEVGLHALPHRSRGSP